MHGKPGVCCHFRLFRVSASQTAMAASYSDLVCKVGVGSPVIYPRMASLLSAVHGHYEQVDNSPTTTTFEATMDPLPYAQ